MTPSRFPPCEFPPQGCSAAQPSQQEPALGPKAVLLYEQTNTLAGDGLWVGLLAFFAGDQFAEGERERAGDAGPWCFLGAVSGEPDADRDEDARRGLGVEALGNTRVTVTGETQNKAVSTQEPNEHLSFNLVKLHLEYLNWF